MDNSSDFALVNKQELQKLRRTNIQLTKLRQNIGTAITMSKSGDISAERALELIHKAFIEGTT